MAGVTYRELHGFTRDLGWKISVNGKRVQHRFLLGHDPAKAELANLRLEQLWQAVVADTERRNAALLPHEEQELPLWDNESLLVAEAIRKHQHVITVPYRDEADISNPNAPGGPVGSAAYAAYLHDLRIKYSMIGFMPADTQAFTRGQAEHQEIAKHRLKVAYRNAAIAGQPVAASGLTLYAAIDEYAKAVVQSKVKDGKPTAWSGKCAEAAKRHKNAHQDITLEAFDYNVIEAIKNYWASRPLGKKTGRPISVETVKNQLKVLKLFCRWLHRNSQFQWRLPSDVESAWKCDFNGIRHDKEVSSMVTDGVAIYRIDELATLWQHAKPHERLLMVLGLNCGFAQAELSSLRRSEVELGTSPPTIKRIRRKSMVYGEFILWPETTELIHAATQYTKLHPDKLLITSPTGKPLCTQLIANIWNRLHEQITKAHPDFRFLPFKYLRKTAAQLIRQASDGETAGVFLCHGQPVKSDDLSDAYTNRPFNRVAEALAKVHTQLKRVFDEGGAEQFTAERKKGGANISRTTIEKIQQLHQKGASVQEIASMLSVSKPTVYRWIKP